jgi:hypothetical protein
MGPETTRGLLYIKPPICTFDLYGPVRNAFDAGSIYYEGKWEGGWALEIDTFLGPVKWHRADRRVPFGGPKESSRRGLVNHSCINS